MCVCVRARILYCVFMGVHGSYDRPALAHASRTLFAQVQAWFQDWGTKMQEPDLTQVLDYSHPLPIVTLKTSVRDAARLMKDMRQTAVLVYDQHQQELHGIFTTKDICLRVLAPNDLEPRSTSVVRVMTPHPGMLV